MTAPLAALAFTAVFAIGCLGAGWRFVPSGGHSAGSSLENSLLSLACGYAAVGGVWAWAAYFGIFHVIWIPVLVLAFFSGARRLTREPFCDRRDIPFLLFLAVPFSFLIYFSFFPSMFSDVLAYHLPAARYFLEEGRLEARFNLPFPTGPQMPSLWFAAGLASSSPAAVLTQTVCAFGAVGLAYALARRFAGELAGWLSACLVLSSTVFQDIAVQALQDASLVFLVTAALAMGTRSIRSGRAIDAAKGILWGGAAAVKYLAWLIILPLAFAAVVRRKRLSRLGVIFFAAAVLPWCVQSARVSGDPFFPVFSARTTADFWTPEDWEFQWERTRHRKGADVGKHAFGLHHVVQRLWNRVGPWILAAPVCLAVAARFSGCWAPFISAAFFLTAWVIYFPLPRYLLPVVPWCAVAVAWVLTMQGRWLVVRRCAAGLLLAFCMAGAFSKITESAQQYGRLPLSAEDKHRFLENHYGPYGAVRFLQGRVSPDRRVWAIERKAVYYLHPYADAPDFGRSGLAAVSNMRENAIGPFLEHKKIAYVLAPKTMNPYQEKNLKALLEKLHRANLPVIYEDAYTLVFRVGEEGA